MAADSSGTVHVVGSAAHYMRKPEGGDWTPPVQISSQMGPTALVSRNNVLYLVGTTAGSPWNDPTGEIYYMEGHPYIIEKVEGTERSISLTMPEPIANGVRYWIQYGHMGIYTDTLTHTFHSRLNKALYNSATMDVLLTEAMAEDVQIGLDVGADGSTDWTETLTYTEPISISVPNFSGALNDYVQTVDPDPEGMVVVPISVSLNTSGTLFLTNLALSPRETVDLSIAPADIAFGDPISPTEGMAVPVTATLHNGGGQNSGPATVAFYAEAPDWGPWYIGSAYVPGVPGGGTTEAIIEWDTSGFTGMVPVSAMADPYDRVIELNEENNEATTDLHIRTRPDLGVGDITFYPTQVVSGTQVTVRAAISNTGETDAGDMQVSFYDGTVVTGTLIATDTLSIPAVGTVPVTTPWVAGPAGEHTITIQADSENRVSESDEGNNAASTRVEVLSAARQTIALGGWDWFSVSITPTLLPRGDCSDVVGTPRFTQYYGQVTVDGQPAPAGTLVEAFSSSDDKVGCFQTTSEGAFGYMRVYGEYISTTTVIPGMQEGEPVSFKVNDFSATTTPSPVIWHDDWLTHTVDLNISTFIKPGTLLASVEEQYDLLLGEEGTYTPPEDNPFNTLTQMLPGLGYMAHMTQAATLLITGTRVSEDSPLDLHEGWNWTGYLPDCTLPVATALASIEGQYTLLLGEEGTYAPPPADPAFNTLDALEPGEGYLIRMTEADTLVYSTDACRALAATLASQSPRQRDVARTPYFSHYYGHAALNGRPVPAGVLIRAYNPEGDEVGRFEVREEGFYGYMRVYGEDSSVTPPVPGMRPGESVTFKIGDLPATPLLEVATWQDDKEIHQLDLTASAWETYLPLLLRGYSR